MGRLTLTVNIYNGRPVVLELADGRQVSLTFKPDPNSHGISRIQVTTDAPNDIVIHGQHHHADAAPTAAGHRAGERVSL